MKGKASSLASKQAMLLELRAGKVKFEVVVEALRPLLKARANYFWRRWRDKQTLLVPEDLVAIMELALWRHVDKWDPSRSPLVTYLDVQLGRAAEKELRKAAGYPDKRRVNAPAKPVYLDTPSSEIESGWLGARAVDGNDLNKLERLLHYYGADWHRPNQEDVLMQRQERQARAASVLSEVKEGYGRKVVELVLHSGYTIQGAADALYKARRQRGYYRLASQDHARRAAYVAATTVRRASERAVAA